MSFAFSLLLQEFETALAQLSFKQEPLNITFSDLKRLRGIKNAFSGFKFLNEIYEDLNLKFLRNSRKTPVSKQGLEPEHLLSEVQRIFDEMMERYGTLDKFRLKLSNLQLTSEIIDGLFQQCSRIIFKLNSFAMFFRNEKEGSYSLASMENIIIGKETFEFILSFFKKGNFTQTIRVKDILASLSKDKTVPPIVSSELQIINGEIAVFALSSAENSQIVAFFKGNNNKIFEKYFAFKGEKHSFPFLIMENIFRAIISVHKLEEISKQNVCQIIERFKYLLYFIGEDVCNLQVMDLLENKFHIRSEILAEGNPEFKILKESWKKEHEFSVQNDLVIFPIFDFNNDVRVFFKIYDPEIDIFLFKMKRHYHKTSMMKQQDIYLQILSENSPQLILAFDRQNNLFYQSKEIPNNLKYIFKFDHQKSMDKWETQNFNDIFEESKFHQKITTEISNLKNGSKYFAHYQYKPQFYLFLNRNNQNHFENTFLIIHNEKDLVVETKEYNSLNNSLMTVPIRSKLEKYWMTLSAYFKLKNEISLEELKKIIEKFEQENSNPIQEMLEENKNTNREDLIFLREYTGQSTHFWSHLMSPTKKKKRSSGTIPSKLSFALFNSMIGQPKDKLFEMPKLIGQISLEMDEVKETRKAEDFYGRNPPTLKKIQSFGSNMLAKKYKSNPEELINICNNNSLDIFSVKNEVLEKLNDWEFSSLGIKDFNKLFNMIWMMFHCMGFLEKYEIGNDIFGRFLSLIQEKYDYRKNPFHNFNHGFTVCHGIYYFLHTKLLNNYLDTLEMFSLLLSGLCHDVDHSGRTNVFEVSSHSRLAIKYNDESVLENNHAAVTFKILCDKEFNILENMTETNFIAFRKNVISNILHTDMKRHFTMIKDFEFQAKDIREDPKGNFAKNPNNKMLFSGMVIHACDLYSATKKFNIAKEWSAKINQEFTLQIMDEERLGLPITPYMRDLDKPVILAKGEIGFIKFIQKPIWNLMNSFFECRLNSVIENLEENIKQWEKILDKELKK